MRYFTSAAVLVFIFSINLSIYPQVNSNKIIAKVGNTSISEEEFLQRYEMTPLFRKHIKRITPSLKLEFLYSLIAEKLWALQAEEFGYDTTRVMEFANSELEKMFVRDALYQRDIKDKIKISDEEMIRAYIRNSKKLLVNFLFSEDEKEIHNLYSMLNNGVPFDSVLAIRPEASEQSKPTEIVFGQTSEEINDSLYALKIGGYTQPIATPDGWYIFRLTNTIKQVFSSESDKENANATVKKVLETYKTKVLYGDYYYNFFKDKKVSVNAPVFQSLARRIAGIFKEKKYAFRIKDKDQIYFDPNDAIKIQNDYGPDSLNINYIEFENSPVTLGRFINILSFTQFSSPDYDLINVAELLDAKTRKVIEEEYLSREGLKDGLNNMPSVQRDLKMWKESYLSQMLQNQFIDSAKISENEVYKYYEKYHKNETYPEQANIIEVLTGSADTAAIILSELKKGADIRKLASVYSSRAWAKKQSGEFGYFPVTMFGEIGERASKMKIGDISGPIKVKDGYSIFQLIGKKPSVTDTAQPYDKVKDELRRELSLKKEHGAITRYTVMLAQKYGVNINKNLLESVDVSNLNMFAYRMMGFGGRITAVPFLIPNTDWVEPYLKSPNITP